MPRTLIIGGGLIGSAVRYHTPGSQVLTGIQWADMPTAIAQLDEAVRVFVNADGPMWQIVWSAGNAIIGSPDWYLHRETTYLDRVLVAAASGYSGTFVHVSSGGGIYGGTTAEWIDDTTPAAPVSAYGINKRAQEQMVGAWVRQTGSRARIVRPSNVYGPRQNLMKPQGLISHVLHKIAHDEPIDITAPLETTRDYIYADDVGKAIASLVGAPIPEVLTAHILASGMGHSIDEILTIAELVTGVRPKINSTPTSLHPARLAFRMGWWLPDTPTPLLAGIRDVWAAMRKQAR